MRRIVLGTRSPGKAREIREILQGMRRLELLDLPTHAPVVVEDKSTFLGNAEKKALEIAEALDAWVLAEDSGLEVDALGGEPGVHSHRWAGEPPDDAANNLLLVERMQGIPPERRTARYRCAAVIASRGEVLAWGEGSCEGRIAEAPAGSGGFGYDPWFLSLELGKTFAQAAPGEKHRVSHRARAMQALRGMFEGLCLKGSAIHSGGGWEPELPEASEASGNEDS